MAARALVTGASGGLGLEFARLLAQAGYDLVLVARSAEALQRNASEIKARFGVEANIVALDLGRIDGAQTLFEQVPECDVLVNNAGFANNGTFAKIPQADLQQEVVLDVVTLTQLSRLYLPGMLERKSGKVLNIASTAAFLPGPNMAVYYASKAYVLSFSEALAQEVRGSGVTVSVLCPGATRTGFQQRARTDETILFRAPLADAATVARAGIDGMMKGKPVIIPGITNKMAAFAPKITPRRLLVWISGKLVERKAPG